MKNNIRSYESRILLIKSTLPMILITALYIISTFTLSNEKFNEIYQVVTIILIVSAIFSLGFACYGVYKLNGWLKILPLLCISVTVIVFAWAIFTLSFNFSF